VKAGPWSHCFIPRPSLRPVEPYALQVVEVLPRVYPLVLGELEPRPPAAKTQGKAGNQLAALRSLASP
jgi:hypothetical protein